MFVDTIAATYKIYCILHKIKQNTSLEMELYSFKLDFHRRREAYLPNPIMEIIQIISGNSTHPIFDDSGKSLLSISTLRKFHLLEALKQFIFSQ